MIPMEFVGGGKGLMKAVLIDIGRALGRSLCATIFRPSGRKLLAKGHILKEDDIRVLKSEGLREAWVAELDSDEIDEDQGVLDIAAKVSAGAVEIRAAAGGRANLFALESGALIVATEPLRQVNTLETLSVATAPPFSHVTAGQRVASIKSAPFAVRQGDIQSLSEVLNGQDPLVQVKPIRNPKVAVLFTDPLQPERAEEQFRNVVRQRMEAINVTNWCSTRCKEEDDALVRSLLHLLKANPTVILIASTTAPAGPGDAVGRAIQAVGAEIERFLAPVEPGNLALLAYRAGVSLIAAPGCYRSAKPNVLNLMMPALLAGHRLRSSEIAGMGAGGLLGS